MEKIQQTDFTSVESSQNKLNEVRRTLDDVEFMTNDALRDVSSAPDETQDSIMTAETPNEDLTMDLTQSVGSADESNLTSQQMESSGYDSTSSKTFTTKTVTTKTKPKVGPLQPTAEMNVGSASTPDRFRLVRCCHIFSLMSILISRFHNF